ncbi:MAG: IS200/IS605 family transposase [bacterium]|nr:IS200/IS605 family transposase [bacterium]
MMTRITHVFHKIYLHITWHSKEDLPQIKPEIESSLYEFIREYCQKNKGVHFKGFGGTENHIHLVVQIEPFVLISELAGKIKGASSYYINQIYGKNTLEWQRGYGVVSFAEKNLDFVLEYIAKQKIHHQKGTINKVLEQYHEIIEELKQQFSSTSSYKPG